VTTSEFDVNAWGVDVFYNSGPWVFEADYSWFAEEMEVGAPDLKGQGWTASLRRTERKDTFPENG
jgi:hypothetical protein